MINNINKNLPTKTDFYNNTTIENINSGVEGKTYNQEVIELFNKLKEEVKSAEMIAIKIIKGENLTSSEQSLISTKYPDLKEMAEKTFKEMHVLKQLLLACKSESEIEQIIVKELDKVNLMTENGVLNSSQGKIKLLAIGELEKFSLQIKEDIKKVERLIIKLIKGKNLNLEEEKFINKKYPTLNKVATKFIKEYDVMKKSIKNCKTNEERKKVIDNLNKDIQYNESDELNTVLQVKVKKVILKELIKYSDNIGKEFENELMKVKWISKKLFEGKKLTLSEKTFIDEKYPKIKVILEESKSEAKKIEEITKQLKSPEEKQQLINNEIKKIKEGNQKDIISQADVSVRLMALSEIIEKEEKERYDLDINYSLNFNPFIYLTFNSIVNNKIGFIIFALIIILALVRTF